MTGRRLKADDPLARELVGMIRKGRLADLERRLAEDPDLARAIIVSEPPACEAPEGRTLLHVASDWPGGYPNGAATVKALVRSGAEVNAPFLGSHSETALHWAASTDDVEVLRALLDAGADIEARGSVIGGGTPLANAVAFGQWQAARLLAARGARAELWQAAALGLMDRLKVLLSGAGEQSPSPSEVTNAFWCACHGGSLDAARLLLERGADPRRQGHDGLTPLEAARRSGAEEVVVWLESLERGPSGG